MGLRIILAGSVLRPGRLRKAMGLRTILAGSDPDTFGLLGA